MGTEVRETSVRSRFGPFGLLCCIAGSRWLVEGGLPATASTVSSQVLGCALAAAFFGISESLAAQRSRPARVPSFPRLAKTGVGTAMVLAGPALAAAISTRPVGSNDASLSLALTPVVVAVCSGTAPEASGDDLLPLLWCGLGGLAGLLLLVPEPASSGWRPWLALSAMPLFTGCGAYLLHSQEADRALAQRSGTAWGCGFAGVVLLGLGAIHVARGDLPRPHWSACGLDGMCVVLSLVSLRQLGAIRWGAQFFLIPLLALVEGVFLLHPSLDVRSWIGFSLLLLGAAKLLAYSGPERSLSLRV